MVDESFVVAELEPKMDPVERFWKRYRKMFGEDPKNLEPSASAYDYLMVCLISKGYNFYYIMIGLTFKTHLMELVPGASSTLLEV